MVMAEMNPRRETRVLVRGRYDQPGDIVSPGVPGFGPGTEELPVEGGDRMALARWLTHPDHPLTARVAVNRWWGMLFGTGIVETVEDFQVLQRAINEVRRRHAAASLATSCACAVPIGAAS